MENITLESFFKAIAWALAVITIFSWIGSRLMRYVEDYEPTELDEDLHS